MGFETLIKNGITLTIGSNVVVDFAMQVGQVAQTVTVEGSVTQVETQSSTISDLVQQSQIKELPLNGRSFEQLLLLAPGVTTTPNVGGGLYYGNAPAYSVSGSRANGQAELLDDTDINNYMNRGAGSGVLGTTLGVDAIGEFQVLTNTYSAQFGGNGAVMNAVSKSGTNDLHGSAYEFIRNSALDAKQYTDPPVIPPFRRNQFGGTLGGPIKKDKMFFFFNYEGLRQALGEAYTAVLPDANLRNGLLPCTAAQASDPLAPCGNNAAFPTYTDFSLYQSANFAKIKPFLDFYPALTAGCSEITGTGTARCKSRGTSRPPRTIS